MRAKVLIAACIATAIFMLDVGSATARRLAITNAEKGFKIVWERFRVEAEGTGGGTIVCPLTLTGTFEVAN